MDTNTNKSEVAALRERIEEEIIAMRRGMFEFAAGTARHDFIKARMERVSGYQNKLAEHVGQREATEICCLAYIEVMR